MRVVSVLAIKFYGPAFNVIFVYAFYSSLDKKPIMTNPEKKVEKSICGDHCDQQQNYGDGDGKDLWDAFELLEIDGNDERSSEQVTGNENWCSVCKVAFSHSCQKQIAAILM